MTTNDMLSAKLQRSLRKAMVAHPIKAGVLIMVGLFAISIFAFTTYFKPAGKRRLRSGRKPRLPPGPSTFTVFRNMILSKRVRGSTTVRNTWLHNLTTYGEMTTMHVGSKTWIILNSNRVVSEMIVKRSSITNTRTPMPVASGISSRDGRSLLLPQEQWAERRRVAQPLLVSGSALKQYESWQEMESTQMMAEYVFKPSRWYKHHYRYANSVIHRIVLGERLAKSTQELDDLQNSVTFFLDNIGKCFVDWYPDFAKLPRFLQFWRPQYERFYEWNYGVLATWWKPVREKVKNGTAPPSFVRDVLLHKDTKFAGDDDAAMYVAMQLIEAGSDTTREALNIMIMASLEYPEVFRKARNEIDALCGTDENARLPVIADMENLRYICAIAKEILRWRPIFVMTPEHASTQDIEFEDYLFPAGVGFVINVFAVSNECENPSQFQPERWLNGHETDIVHGLWGFGGGRRICVGYRLAQRSLFINIARLVQCVDYRANGPYDPNELNHKFTTEPFPVHVSIRNQHYAKLIIKEAESQCVLEAAKA